MTVTVDLAVVARDWASYPASPRARLLFVDAQHPDFGDQVAAKDALTRAIEIVVASEQWIDDEGMECTATRPVLFPRAVTTKVGSSSLAPLLGFVQALAAQLGADQWSGKLTARTDLVREEPIAPAEFGMSSVLALSGWGEHGGAQRKAIVPWRTGAPIASVLTEVAMDWLTGAGRLELLHVSSVPASSPAELRELIHVALADQGAPSYMSATQTDEVRRRTVTFVGPGHVIVHSRDAAIKPSSFMDLHTTFLRKWTSLVDWAAMTLSPSVAPASLERLLVNAHGLRVPRYYEHCRYLDRERLPDAFAWQVVTDQHLEAAHDLSSWTVQPVGDGMNELVAPSIGDWLEAPRGDRRLGVTPAVPLEAARLSFGALLHTEDSPPLR